MNLKETIIWNGANPEDYSAQELKQIKYLLSGKIHQWAAHKQLVEKFGFQCYSDRPCYHPTKMTHEEWVAQTKEIEDFVETYGVEPLELINH